MGLDGGHIVNLAFFAEDPDQLVVEVGRVRERKKMNMATVGSPDGTGKAVEDTAEYLPGHSVRDGEHYLKIELGLYVCAMSL